MEFNFLGSTKNPRNSRKLDPQFHSTRYISTKNMVLGFIISVREVRSASIREPVLKHLFAA